MIYFLDLLGTWAFAAYGAHKAQRCRFDIFGISTIAFISGLGGGTIRDIFLNSSPAYLSKISYVVVVILGIVFALVFGKAFNRLSRFMLTIDAVGLVAFAYIGAEHAGIAGFGLLGSVFFATVTAVGGSLLRDISMQKIPEVFYQDFYATPAILLGCAYFLLKPFMQFWLTPAILLSVVFIIRMLAIHYKIQLWKPNEV